MAKQIKTRLPDWLLPTIDEAGVIAVKISKNLTEELTSQQQSFFIAGFQECIKYLQQK